MQWSGSMIRFAAAGGCAAALLAAWATGGRAGSAALHPVLSAKLTPAAEVPRGSSTGSGSAVIALNAKTGRACWTIKVRLLIKPLSAHIHKAPPGKIGPVVVPLGDRFATKGCVLVPAKTLLAVERNPSAYYVNVHTKKNLNGAIRGRLRAAS